MDLFDRIVKVTVWSQPTGFVGQNPGYFDRIGNGIEILGAENPLGLHIKASVEKNLASEPNKCEITIVNLAEHTRNELEKVPTYVRLEAGYAGVPRLLFYGNLRYGSAKYTGTEWETTLQVGDGARAHAFARVNKSYRPPVQVSTVLSDIAATMGLQLPEELDQSIELKQALKSGISLHGPSREFLTKILAPYGYNWSTQNGRLQILKDEEVRQNEAVLVDESTGLIGSPQRSVPEAPNSFKPESYQQQAKHRVEWTWEMFLYPELNPGSKAKLDTRWIKGIGKIIQVTHTIDSRTGPFKSACKAFPLGGNS